jgi:rhamnosyltransferase
MKDQPIEPRLDSPTSGSRADLGKSANDAQPFSPKRVFVGPTKENICAILVTYYPDALFAQRLERIRDQVGRILIVDNTADAKCGLASQLVSDDALNVLENKENLGIGAALNQGLTRAIQLGYQWMITFDQDSWVHEDLVTTLISIVEQQPQPDLVGIIGCNFEHETSHLSTIKHKVAGPNFSEAKTVITSGSLLSAAVFSAVGPFRSDFFIDFVDHEYCLRLRKLGYSVLTANAPLMVHALGAPTPLSFDTAIGKFSLVLTNRSPLRRYYMTRNGILVAKAYFSVAPIWALKTLGSVLGFALLKIPFEKTARWKKFCATILGALDALRSKSGKARRHFAQ